MNQTVDGAILEKTLSLCQTILDEPMFKDIRRQLDAFQGDETVQLQYQELNEKGAALQQKQRAGQDLTDAEIADFERGREAFLSNPVARDFLEAQQVMHDVRDTVTKYVSRTFELGRMPGPDDFHSCGHGCSCG